MTPADAEAIVRAFLAATERRDAAAAQAILHPQARLNFPCGRSFASASEHLASSARRYQYVGKKFERFDVIAEGRRAIVYCFGVLHGSFADDTTFDGIRFIDRFEIEDGLILRQDVWNDVDR